MGIIRKGLFFSLDALIATMIIFLVILIAFPSIKEKRHESEIHEDILVSLSSLKVNEFNNAYTQALIASGQITNSNKTLLEQIGEFYITNQSIAIALANEFMSTVDVGHENIGIWFDNVPILLKNSTPIETATQIDTTRQVISGIQAGSNITGYSARAFISNNLRTKYTYIGGYVGEGNISFNISLSGNISSAEIELVSNKNFTMYINGQSAGVFAKSPSDTVPARYNISTNSFISGDNIIELRADKLYISGGFIKITYSSDIEYAEHLKYRFPGIEGLINLYDGFTIPGTINTMNINLHVNSSQVKLFLNIGNTTVWNATNSQNSTNIISNAQLSSLLNYNQLVGKTTPLRLGIENETQSNGTVVRADIILITDTSGSMDWRLNVDNQVGTTRNCSDPSLYNSTTKRISLAKCLDMNFISTILTNPNNRIGLVSFSTSANSYVNLTTNITLLNSTIQGYTATGSTCLSCALNRAYLILQAQSNSSVQKYVISMTDGVANHRSTPVCYNINGGSRNVTGIIEAAEVGSLGAITHFKNNSIFAPNSPTATSLNKIDLYNDTLGFAVGASYQFFKWNGTGWGLNVDLGSQSMLGVDLFNATFGYAVGTSGKIAKWSGTSWTEFIDTGSESFNDISFMNKTFAFAVADSGKIFNWSGGSGWSEFIDTGNNDFQSIDMWNRTHGFAGDSSSQIYKWNGTMWNLFSTIGSGTITDISIINSTLVFVTDSNGVIYQGNGNSTWITKYTGIYSLNAIVMMNSTQAYATGDSREGVIIWNGSSWTKQFTDYLYTGNSTTGLDCSDPDSCSESKTIPMLNANYSSCRIHNEQNATVHSIGFGPTATCSFSSTTLQAVATCGNGSFYASSDAQQLQQIYQQIAGNITTTYQEQTISTTSNAYTRLYPDSFIEVDYTPQITPIGITIGIEKPVTNTTTGSWTIPSGVTVLDTYMTSYSGAKWTNTIIHNGTVTYNLSSFGSIYTILGDPFATFIPNSNTTGNHTIKFNLGTSPLNIFEGSSSNKIIYTLSKNLSTFAPISTTRDGCTWTIEFESGLNATIPVPSNYTGAVQCTYQQGNINYNQNDAAAVATYNLFSQLDLDGNGLLEVEFNANSVSIALSEVNGIPYPWSTEVQVRRWT